MCFTVYVPLPVYSCITFLPAEPVTSRTLPSPNSQTNVVSSKLSSGLFDTSLLAEIILLSLNLNLARVKLVSLIGSKLPVRYSVSLAEASLIVPSDIIILALGVAGGFTVIVTSSLPPKPNGELPTALTV